MSLASELQDFYSHDAMAASKFMQPPAIPVYVVNGSWDQSNHTVKVWLAHDLMQYELDENGNEDFVNPQQLLEKIHAFGPYPMATGGIGTSFAPVGGEYGYLIPTMGGMLVILTHYDTGPGQVHNLQAGEWIAAQPKNYKTSFYDLRNDGSATHSATTKAIVTAPQVILGETDAKPEDGVVRQENDQRTTDAIIAACQAAINQLAMQVQPGSGVPPPTIEPVIASASNQCFASAGSTGTGIPNAPGLPGDLPTVPQPPTVPTVPSPPPVPNLPGGITP